MRYLDRLELYILYIKALLRETPIIASRVISVKTIYRGWHKVLEAYILGKQGFVELRDPSGGGATVEVNSSNARIAIILARILHECRRRMKYKIRDNRLAVSTPNGDSEKFNILALLSPSEDFLRLSNICYLYKYNIDFKVIDEKHYLINHEGLRWKARRYAGDVVLDPFSPEFLNPMNMARGSRK